MGKKSFEPIKKPTPKPHFGRIKDWGEDPLPSLGPRAYRIVGHFLDHPYFRGPDIHTSVVVSHDRATGEIETNNSRYTLVNEGEESRRPGFAMKGDRVQFLAAHGYDREREDACAFFTKGQELIVPEVNVGDSRSTYVFEGRPGLRFNTVMFGPPLAAPSTTPVPAASTTPSTTPNTATISDTMAVLLRIDALEKVLHAYAAWEADLLTADECWPPYAATPKISQRLWDRLVEIQGARNAALRKEG